MRVWSLAALALWSAVQASAQPAPLPASAPAGAPPFPSAFEGYQSFKDAPVAPWKDSNDTVGRIGGWRAYAREAAQAAPAPGQASNPEAAPAAPPVAAPAPAPGAHRH